MDGVGFRRAWMSGLAFGCTDAVAGSGNDLDLLDARLTGLRGVVELQTEATATLQQTAVLADECLDRLWGNAALAERCLAMSDSDRVYKQVHCPGPIHLLPRKRQSLHDSGFIP